MHDLFTRREFVHRGLGLIGLCGSVPTFLSRTVWAMTDPMDVPRTPSQPGGPDDRVLVVVQLAGGNDGLNTVVPYRHDLYYRARRRIAIAPQDGLRLDDEYGILCRVGLHCAPAAHRTMGTFPHGTVRFGLSAFNTAEEVRVAVDAVCQLAPEVS